MKDLRANTSNAAERKGGHLRSRFGGVLEEQVSNLAGHFRYLALLLDAYDKHFPKINGFVRQLQFSDSLARPSYAELA
jgi:hypothetical protein